MPNWDMAFLRTCTTKRFVVNLTLRGIPFQREVQFQVLYKGLPLASVYRSDLVCQCSIMLN